MKIEDIRINRKRALMIDPVSLTGWHQLTNAYLQSRFERSGIPVDRLQFNPEFVKKNVEQSLTDFVGLMGRANEIYDFVITVNRIPSNIYNIEFAGEIRDLYSFSQVPIVTWLVDNIGHHQQLFAERPLAKEVFLVSDASSISTGRDFGHDLTENAFMPMWGAERSGSLPSFEDRDIDIVFAGDIWPVEPRTAFLDRVSVDDAGIRKIVENVLEQMVADTGETDALRLLIDACKEDGRPESAQPLFTEIDPWLRRYRRKNLLRRIERAPVTICGTVEDPDLLGQENLEVLGRKNVDETAGIAQRAKVFLGDFANFVGGVELRPSMAMANGAVFAGEENAYFRTAFEPDMYIGLSHIDGPLDDAVLGHVSSLTTLEDMDAKAAERYMAYRKEKIKLSQ